jgi:tRNA(His) 5'-end guanylyltransferase
MACSKYEYVKKFEEVRSIIPQTYILVRIDVQFLIFREGDLPNFAQHMNSKNQTISEQ